MARDTKYMRGLDQALRQMKNLREGAAAAMLKPMNKGVEDMAKRIRVLSPSARIRRDGVRTDAGVTPRTAKGRPVFRTRVYVPNNPYFWSRFLEFGTIRQNAQPFFWPSVRSLQKRVTASVKRSLNKAAKETVRGR